MSRPGPKGGRPRKPTAKHVEDGTYRADRHSEPEPEFTGGGHTPPAELNGDARKEWRRMYPELKRLGMWTMADRAVFAAYCQAYADYMMLTGVLNRMEGGWVCITDKGYPVLAPEVNARQKVWSTMKEAASRFGFTPSDRAGLPVAPPAKKPGEETPEDFLFGEGASGPRLL